MKMKKILSISILTLLLLPMGVWAQASNYEFRNFTMNFPNSYYVINEHNVDEHAAFIESYGILPENVKEIFSTSNEVTLALRSDEQVAMHLYINEDEFSKQVWNLVDASDSQRKTFEHDISGSLEGDYTIAEQRFVLLGEPSNEFLKTVAEFADGHSDISYATLHNGFYHELKFNNYSLGNLEDTMAEIENIAASLQFASTEDRPPTDSGTVWIIIGAALFVVGTTIYLVVTKLKKPSLDQSGDKTEN